jgi:hypothetical protein
LRDQPIDVLRVAAVLRSQDLDLGDPPLMLGDDPLAPLVRDAEQRALELARDPLQVLGRSCTPAVSSGVGADVGVGAPVSGGPSRNAIRAWVWSRARRSSSSLRSSALICAVSMNVVKPSVGDSCSS